MFDALYGLSRLQSVARVGTAARAFAGAQNVETAWSLAGSVVGVIGPDKLVNSLIRYTGHLATRVVFVDQEAAEEFVQLARSRAPRLTGALQDGIEATQVGGSWVIQASAQRYGNTADYARMVEFGTAAGERGRRVASDDYFAGPYSGRRGSLNDETGRRRRAADARRRVNRTHPGTPAQPFFMPTVREVLERRLVAMERVSDEAASVEDLL